MKIRILCVGKIKESFYRDAVSEYLKRLSRYVSVSVVEVADEKTPDNASKREEEIILEKEGERLLSKINEDDLCIVTAIGGDRHSSESFARQIDEMMLKGVGNAVFVIGGSLGLSEKVLKRADRTISFSDMTFPHQLMRVILLEQIYRGFRIIRSEPYHK